MLRTIAVWLVVLAQPLQACCSGICVPVPKPKAQRGCCQGLAKAGKSNATIDETDSPCPSRARKQAPKGSACPPPQIAGGRSCCKPAKEAPAVQSCCSVKKAPPKCGKTCGPQSAKADRAPEPARASNPSIPATEARAAESGEPGCRARHEGCCCCWPIPKDIPAPIGHKLPQPVLSAQLAPFSFRTPSSRGFAPNSLHPVGNPTLSDNPPSAPG